MKINFFNLKEPADLSVRTGLSESPFLTTPEIRENSLTEAGYLTEYVIQEMFNVHMQSSQTLWDRKMFDDELKREGSGFIVCYSGGGEEKITPRDKNGAAASKFNASDIQPDLILNMQSRIIGFFIFYNVIDEMHILDITVAKEMQSKGIGTLMLDYAVKKYGSIDNKIAVKHFFLEVRVSNKPAISLYKKAGFKIFMLRKNYYDDNGEDALCMVKEL